MQQVQLILGRKQGLTEGGVISLSFIYWTKNNLPSRRLSNLIHITDWFPTILSLVGINLPVESDLDGIDQSNIFFEENPIQKREKMVYGILDVYRGVYDKWLHGYAVRIGKYKFYSFSRNWSVHKCSQTSATSASLFSQLETKFSSKSQFQGYKNYLLSQVGRNTTENFYEG